MSFLNSTLLLGLLALAIPVILHYLLKQKPKKMAFPALRLLQQKQQQSTRRLKIRQWFLLALRILFLAAIVFALARPSVPPANYSLTRFELFILLGVIGAGIAAYLLLFKRLQSQGLTTYQQTERGEKIRNRVLLASLLGILILVGWPYQRRIAAEIGQPRNVVSSLDLPVAGIMLFDNSLSMSYLEAGETSLDLAVKIAKSHLQTLPSGSRVAVGESSNDRPLPFQTTINAALRRLEAIEPVASQIPLDDRIREAIKSQIDDRDRVVSNQSQVEEANRKDQYVRRIYLFTDFAKSAWRTAGHAMLLAELQREQNLNLYLIDVGRTTSQNQSIQQISPSRERIPIGGELSVAANLLSQGQDVESQQVELFFNSRSGEFLKQGQVSTRLQSGVSTQIEFPVINGLTQPWVQGEVRLSGTDQLLFDNSRYFTVQVTEPPAVLVVGPDQATAQAWMTALAPHQKQSQSLNKYLPVFESIQTLPQMTLDKFSVVTLINCPRLADPVWAQLARYVEQGGGLIVILGSDQIQSDSYRRAVAQQFLPGLPEAWQPLGDWSFQIKEPHHPLFSIFRRLENYGAFAMFENDVDVRRFWKVNPAEGAQVLARYDDAEAWPAILERSYGRGRTIMLTTAASLPANPNLRWNNLPSPLLESWLFLAFVDQLTDFAGQLGVNSSNFASGDTVVLNIGREADLRTFLLRHPDLRQTQVELAAGEASLALKDLQTPGHYQVIGGENREVIAGFSLNVRTDESDLTRLTTEDLNDRLGADRFQVAQSLEELKDRINAADLGQEIYPILLVLVIVFFCGEMFVGNRFYQRSDS